MLLPLFLFDGSGSSQGRGRDLPERPESHGSLADGAESLKGQWALQRGRKSRQARGFAGGGAGARDRHRHRRPRTSRWSARSGSLLVRLGTMLGCLNAPIRLHGAWTHRPMGSPLNWAHRPGYRAFWSVMCRLVGQGGVPAGYSVKLWEPISRLNLLPGPMGMTRVPLPASPWGPILNKSSDSSAPSEAIVSTRQHRPHRHCWILAAPLAALLLALNVAPAFGAAELLNWRITPNPATPGQTVLFKVMYRNATPVPS